MNESSPFPIGKKELIVLCLFLAACAALFRSSSFKGYATSDPYGSLLLSQTILRQGTLNLGVHPKPVLDRYHWQIFERNGRTFYGYPLGTSVLMIPFVGVANLFKMDMRRPHLEIECQRHLAALSAAAVMLFIFLLARCFFPAPYSFLLTALLGLGSGVASTMGIGLFSLNLEVLFILWSFLLIVRARLEIRRLNPYLLGTLLFLAYFCRPTAALVIVAVFCFLLITDRRAFFKTALTAFAPFIIFTLFSRAVYDINYPGFYNLDARTYSAFAWHHVYGLLLSPSRGLLIFSPFLLVTFTGAVLFIRRLYRRPEFWMGIGSFLLIFALISNWSAWEGGGSYGYRLLLDGYPGLILVTFLVLRQGLESGKGKLNKAAAVFLTVSGGISLFIHSGQGLFNTATERWNYPMNGKNNEDLVMDWRYPQFLASENSLARRTTQLGLTSLKRMVGINRNISLEGGHVFFEGFSSIEQSGSGPFRRANGESARIWINLRPQKPLLPKRLLNLEFRAEVSGQQSWQVYLNKVPLGTLGGTGNRVSGEFRFPFFASQLGDPGENNVYLISVEFRVSDPPSLLPEKEAGNSHPGISLYTLSVRRAEQLLSDFK